MTVLSTTADTLVVVLLVELVEVLVELEVDVDVDVDIDVDVELDVIDVVVLEVVTLVEEPPSTDVVVEELVLDEDGTDGGRSVPGGVTGETSGVLPPQVSS